MKRTSPFMVLLVEDHEDSREAIKRWFEWKGWQVLTASDKKSGLALARKNPIDLLLCDLQLPDGNGWELMEQLSTVKKVRAIMTSGHCAPTDVARSKAAGFMEHLVKPYPVEELDALLERIQRQIEKQDDSVPAEKTGSKR